MLQWSQRRAALQLDAAHAARMQMLLEQLAPADRTPELIGSTLPVKFLDVRCLLCALTRHATPSL